MGIPWTTISGSAPLVHIDVKGGETTRVFRLGDEVTYSSSGHITSFEKDLDNNIFAHLDFSPNKIPMHELRHLGETK